MLVRVYHTRAVRAVDLIVRDTALAEDVVQSAFVRAYERIGQFDSHRPFGPWFMRVVVNDAVKAASRRKPTVPFYEGGAENLLARLADPSVGPHEMAEEAETRRRVWRAMEELPPAQRAVIVQRYYLGMSEAEMAQRGGSPPGTIKSRLNAARKGLSKLLRPHLRTQSTPTPIDNLSDPLESRDGRD
jgi:RNA polymerase sigma-70 factor (ECF subfamily)